MSYPKMSKKNLVVYAFAVSDVHVYFECPFCYDRYKKDGMPAKNAKRTIHFHGSAKSKENSIEGRLSHCEIYKGEYYVVIDDRTARISSLDARTKLRKILDDYKKQDEIPEKKADTPKTKKSEVHVNFF
jgi:hypothetical protein